MRKVHQQIRSFCREEARRIIQKDRKAKKYGDSQNTIGEIERAMIAAYRMGLDGYGDPERKPLHDKIGWDDLPPRARELLEYATWHRTLRADPKAEVFDDLQQLSIDGKMRWATVNATGVSSHSMASGAGSALLKHRLIDPLEGEPGRYRINEQGKAICRDYWQRSAAGDPGLPLMNIRA